jgi:hypothetical protein
MMLVLRVEGEELVAQQVGGDYADYRFSSLAAAHRHAAWARRLAANGDRTLALAARLDFESVESELSS